MESSVDKNVLGIFIVSLYIFGVFRATQIAWSEAVSDLKNRDKNMTEALIKTNIFVVLFGFKMHWSWNCVEITIFEMEKKYLTIIDKKKLAITVEVNQIFYKTKRKIYEKGIGGKQQAIKRTRSSEWRGPWKICECKNMDSCWILIILRGSLCVLQSSISYSNISQPSFTREGTNLTTLCVEGTNNRATCLLRLLFNFNEIPGRPFQYFINEYNGYRHL